MPRVRFGACRADRSEEVFRLPNEGARLNLIHIALTMMGCVSVPACVLPPLSFLPSVHVCLCV
jgi:hypothetical protein